MDPGTEAAKPHSRRAGAERTRVAILETARGLFAEAGYRGTSVADIAEAAGLAPGTIYVHFKNKADLLAEVIRSTEPNDLVLSPEELSRISVAEMFSEIAAISIRQAETNAAFLTSMAHEARKFPETRADFYRQVMLRPMQAVAGLLAHVPGCAELDESDRRALAHVFLSAAVFTVVEQEILGGAECDPIDIERVPALLGLLLEGGVGGISGENRTKRKR